MPTGDKHYNISAESCETIRPHVFSTAIVHLVVVASHHQGSYKVWRTMEKSWSFSSPEKSGKFFLMG